MVRRKGSHPIRVPIGDPNQFEICAVSKHRNVSMGTDPAKPDDANLQPIISHAAALRLSAQSLDV